LAARLRLRLYQRRPQRLVEVLGQDLEPGHQNTLFLLGNFLCSGNDARLDSRSPVVEPGAAWRRLVSFELLCRIRAVPARPGIPRNRRRPCTARRAGAGAPDAPPTLRAPVIRLERVSKCYRTRAGPRTVLDEVSATFAAGHNTGILGQNGTGKSTLIR